MSKHNWVSDAVVLDFESLPIAERPCYPSEPVGLAISWPGKKSRYIAWGHPTGDNNGSWFDAKQELVRAYESGRPLLYHNAKYDVEVASEFFGLPWPEWTRIHDTLPMLFLLDPRMDSYALKPACEKLLDVPPDEKDAVVEWLIEHQPVRGKKLNNKPSGKNYAGAYVALSSVKVAGPYAIGDVDRTRSLARYCYRELVNRGMVEPYDVERELMPYLVLMERDGVRVDVRRLSDDIEQYEQLRTRLDIWLHKKLGVHGDIDFNIDSSVQLVKALTTSGLVTEEDLGYTDNGNVQTNKAALTGAIKDKQLLAALTYRTQLNTCLGTFMKPWLATALASGGLIFTQWHSTRRDKGESGVVGTRTGRLSSTPNFQNLVKLLVKLFASMRQDKLPAPPVKHMLELPLVRSYVIPYSNNEVFIDRDYSQQELRALGHFEGGVLCEAYNKEPWLDLHEYAQKLINSMLNTDFERKPIKNTGFGLIYGMGIGTLAEKSGTTVEMAKKVREAYLNIFPGLKDMYAEMKRRARDNEPIRTWGGREYYCEDPVWSHKYKRYVTFDYKLLNILIQGSSADCTKRAVINYCKTKPRHHRLHFITHDQLTASVPRHERDSGMDIMRATMECVKFDVPMLTDGKWSDKNWSALQPFDKKGKLVCR